MLERFLVPEKDKGLVSEADARAATEAIFVSMGLPGDGAPLATASSPEMARDTVPVVSRILSRLVQQDRKRPAP
jgi:hypothetical protein